MIQTDTALPAAVIVAHDKPRQLRRLIEAIDPWPVYLHVDANTPRNLYDQLVTDLPPRVRLLPRHASGWATYGTLAAELDGYRAALRETEAPHIALLTGADYPLASTTDLQRILASRPGMSFTSFFGFPKWSWLPLAGYDRVYFRNSVCNRRRRLNLIPRRLPPGLRPAAGSQLKILSREHAHRLLAVLDSRPELEAYFRTVWIPDEVMVPTMLTSPSVSPAWRDEVAWPAHFIRWSCWPQKNPPWLGPADFDALRAAAHDPAGPALFARKFADDGGGVIARIDAELRGVR